MFVVAGRIDRGAAPDSADTSSAAALLSRAPAKSQPVTVSEVSSCAVTTPTLPIDDSAVWLVPVGRNNVEAAARLCKRLQRRLATPVKVLAPFTRFGPGTWDPQHRQFDACELVHDIGTDLRLKDSDEGMFIAVTSQDMRTPDGESTIAFASPLWAYRNEHRWEGRAATVLSTYQLDTSVPARTEQRLQTAAEVLIARHRFAIPRQAGSFTGSMSTVADIDQRSAQSLCSRQGYVRRFVPERLRELRCATGAADFSST